MARSSTPCPTPGNLALPAGQAPTNLPRKRNGSASRTPGIRDPPESTPPSPTPAPRLGPCVQASIWGHCPHYVNTSPDPKVSHALLTRLRSLIDIDVDLEELYIAGNAYQEEVDKVIAKQPDVSSYVRRLERRYDEARTATEEIPSPETMVQELENFLRSQTQGGSDEVRRLAFTRSLTPSRWKVTMGVKKAGNSPLNPHPLPVRVLRSREVRLQPLHMRPPRP